MQLTHNVTCQKLRVSDQAPAATSAWPCCQRRGNRQRCLQRQQQRRATLAAAATSVAGSSITPIQAAWAAAAPAGVAYMLALCLPCAAYAARPTPPMLGGDTPERCAISALDKFADTRAKFSQEASGGNMVEAMVDVRGCDFSKQDLSGKVLSGVMLQGAKLDSASIVGSQFARADARGASLAGADLTDTNCYGSRFDGADLRGAQFENSILTGASFGRDETGQWAQLAGAHFEGALLSSSDVTRVCENPTLEDSTKKYELGCKLKGISNAQPLATRLQQSCFSPVDQTNSARPSISSHTAPYRRGSLAAMAMLRTAYVLLVVMAGSAAWPRAAGSRWPMEYPKHSSRGLLQNSRGNSNTTPGASTPTDAPLPTAPAATIADMTAAASPAAATTTSSPAAPRAARTTSSGSNNAQGSGSSNNGNSDGSSSNVGSSNSGSSSSSNDGGSSSGSSSNSGSSGDGSSGGSGSGGGGYEACVCAFDFDFTLRVASLDDPNIQNLPAKDGHGIIQDCKANGYDIAIASANGEDGQIKPVLAKVDNATFTDDFYSTPAFQYGIHNKTIELLDITAYYGARPQCTILFDDLEHNRQYADLIGSHFSKANPIYGVQWYQWQDAKWYVENKQGCRCKGSGQQASGGSSSSGSTSGSSSQQLGR